jgi:hypothetical protein
MPVGLSTSDSCAHTSNNKRKAQGILSTSTSINTGSSCATSTTWSACSGHKKKVEQVTLTSDEELILTRVNDTRDEVILVNNFNAQVPYK